MVSEPSGGTEVKKAENDQGDQDSPQKDDPNNDSISETSSQVSNETPPNPAPTTEVESRKSSTSSDKPVVVRQSSNTSATVTAEAENTSLQESIDESSNSSNTHNTLDSTDADSGIEVKAVLEKTEDDEDSSSSWVKADYPATGDVSKEGGEASGSNLDSTGEIRDFSSDETITNVPVAPSNVGLDHPDIDPFNNSSESQSNENSFADFATFETPMSEGADGKKLNFL